MRMAVHMWCVSVYTYICYDSLWVCMYVCVTCMCACLLCVFVCLFTVTVSLNKHINMSECGITTSKHSWKKKRIRNDSVRHHAWTWMHAVICCDHSHQLYSYHTHQITACITASAQSLRASHTGKEEVWLLVGVIAQWQSAGSVSQRPFLCALCWFKCP